MFQDAGWNELEWPQRASTGLLEQDDLEADTPSDAEEDDGSEKEVEELDRVPGALGLCGDGRRRSEEDEDFDDDVDDEDESFEEEDENLEEDFDEDFDENEDLDDDPDEDLDDDDV
jgi:hypothetical protein